MPRTNQTLEQVNTLKQRIPQETLRVMLRTSTQISVEPNYLMNGLKTPRVSLKTPRVFLETSQVSTKTPRVPLEFPRVSLRTPRVHLETPRVPRTNQILEPVKKLYIRIPQETLRVLLRTFILISVKPSYSMNGLKTPRMSMKTPRVSLETQRVSLKTPRVSLVPRTHQPLEQMKKTVHTNSPGNLMSDATNIYHNQCKTKLFDERTEIPMSVPENPASAPGNPTSAPINSNTRTSEQGVPQKATGNPASHTHQDNMPRSSSSNRKNPEDNHSTTNNNQTNSCTSSDLDIGFRMWFKETLAVP